MLVFCRSARGQNGTFFIHLEIKAMNHEGSKKDGPWEKMKFDMFHPICLGEDGHLSDNSYSLSAYHVIKGGWPRLLEQQLSMSPFFFYSRMELLDLWLLVSWHGCGEKWWHRIGDLMGCTLLLRLVTRREECNGSFNAPLMRLLA